jgi:hypothetical protein
MHFYIGFFLPISMNLNMKKKLILGLPALCMAFLVSCEKNTRVRGPMKMTFCRRTPGRESLYYEQGRML